MRRISRKINHFIRKQTRTPYSMLKRAIRKSNAIRHQFTGYVTENPLKTSGILAVGLVAISGVLIGLIRRR